MRTNNTRLTYQPFLFGASIAALVVKVALSRTMNREVFDITLYCILAITLISAVLYGLDRRKRRRSTEIRTDIKVGDTTRTEILGAEASKRDVTSVKIETGKVTDGRVTGYRERGD